MAAGDAFGAAEVITNAVLEDDRKLSISMSPKTSKKPYPIQHLNAWRMHRQWLDRPFKGRDLLDLVRSVGWIHSPGCSSPYLSLWARSDKFQPASLDNLVFKEQKLVRLETLRGCTMLVPREDAPIALRVRSRTFTDLAREARALLPINEKELDQLKNAVIRAMEGGLTTRNEIRDSVPSHLVRDFPLRLKRIGLTESVSLAIRVLEEDGRIVKVQSGKQLNSTEYTYQLLSNVLPEVDPFELKTEIANIELARLYFRSEGPARVKDFAWWAGINVTDAIRAAEEVQPGLETIKVAHSKDEFFLGGNDLEEFANFTPDNSTVNLIPYRDIYLKGQREVVDRFVSSDHSDKPFTRWRGKLMSDPIATVIRNGQVVGVWEWDSAAKGTLNFELFEKGIVKPDLGRISKRAAELARFIRKNLKDGRLQGTDSNRQMTRISDLKTYWGQGAEADVRAL